MISRGGVRVDTRCVKREWTVKHLKFYEDQPGKRELIARRSNIMQWPGDGA